MAETILALAAVRGLDLVPVDADAVNMRALDHIDVLVLVSDRIAKNSSLMEGISEFVSRGGKVVGFGSGVKALPSGGVACRDGKKAVSAVKGMAK